MVKGADLNRFTHVYMLNEDTRNDLVISSTKNSAVNEVEQDVIGTELPTHTNNMQQWFTCKQF